MPLYTLLVVRLHSFLGTHDQENFLPNGALALEGLVTIWSGHCDLYSGKLHADLIHGMTNKRGFYRSTGRGFLLSSGIVGHAIDPTMDAFRV
jgi:hypothetical protein